MDRSKQYRLKIETPSMTFVLNHEHKFAFPVNFRNDYTGTHSEVVLLDGNLDSTGKRPRMFKDLQRFADTWFRNLKHQGFFAAA